MGSRLHKFAMKTWFLKCGSVAIKANHFFKQVRTNELLLLSAQQISYESHYLGVWISTVDPHLSGPQLSGILIYLASISAHSI